MSTTLEHLFIHQDQLITVNYPFTAQNRLGDYDRADPKPARSSDMLTCNYRLDQYSMAWLWAQTLFGILSTATRLGNIEAQYLFPVTEKTIQSASAVDLCPAKSTKRLPLKQR